MPAVAEKTTKAAAPKPAKAPAATKAPAAPKQTPAKDKPAAAPKAPKTPAPAKEKADGGLRKPQVRILTALVKSAVPLDRKTLAAKAPVDVAACVEYVGSHDEAVRKANDEKHFPSLVTLGLIKFGPPTESGGTTYEVTAKGRKELEKLNKPAK
jgi:hypothetical protein